MRVVHVDTALGWRGGQNQVLWTARGMASRGHEVTLACRSGSVLETRAREAGLEVRSLPFHGDVSPRATQGLARILRETRPEVVQLHDPHALAAGALAARLAGHARLIATRRVDFPLRGLLSRWKYRSAHRIVAVSRAIASVLEGGGLSADRIRIVYEGVPERPPLRGGPEFLRSLGIPEKAPVVGNVAALVDHKDHETLLAAAALVLQTLPDARFVVVGGGQLQPRLEARVRELGLFGRCHLVGFRTDLDSLIPAFTVFCLSSRTEGLGTSLLDAMAFGRPVVATAAGGIPEAVEDGVTGKLVPVSSPEALARALLDVLQDAALRDSLGAAGRRLFLERFTADRMVDETLRVYAELLREP